MTAPAPDRVGSVAGPAPPRLVVVWCPDWPVVAAALDPEAPVAVLDANRVVAASLAARREGVLPGLRRRAAQACCPDLTLVPRDPAREARAFEGVLRAVEVVTPLLEITAPGTITFRARGPARYHGGEEALVGQVSALVTTALGEQVATAGPPGVGLADGRFAATLAARWAARTGRAHHVVPPGASAAFLAPLPVSNLADPGLDAASLDVAGLDMAVLDMAGLLRRLGLRTLGQFAALAPADVIGRFGPVGLLAHQAARGADDRPPGVRACPPELSVHEAFEPPVLQSGPVIFTAKHLADELHAELRGRGLVVVSCLVQVETEHSEKHERIWRHDAGLTAAALAERVRWQLEGWATGPARPTGGITSLRLVPLEVLADEGRQLGFWGGRQEAERVVRTVARLSGLLGPEAVTVPEWRGGRGLTEGVTAVPAAAVDLLGPDRRVGPPTGAGPWPGRLPPPSPARVPVQLVPAVVVDEDGRQVSVSGRWALSGSPALLALESSSPQRIEAWAGPWPVDERWWEPVHHRRRARFQVVTEDGRAHALVLAQGRWWSAATYD